MSPACTVIMAVRITGPLDKTRFGQAFDAVARIHPFFRVKIVLDERHEAYFSSADVPSVPLQIISPYQITSGLMR